MTHPYFADTHYPRIFAHRGLAVPGSKDEPAIWENSAGAIASAEAIGIEYIETDCQVTADGDVVLFHDDTLLRLADDPRLVEEVSTRELQDRFADHGGLLTIQEALYSFPELRFNIDVKSDAVADRIGSALAPHGHRVLVTSFSDSRRRRALDGVKNAGATMRPATSGGRNTIAAVLASSTLGLSPAAKKSLRDIDALQIPLQQGRIPVLTDRLQRAAQKLGVEVHIWTINDPERMQALIDRGVDGIVTDHADLALDTLR